MFFGKKDVIPLLMHWSYIFPVLNHQYKIYLMKHGFQSSLVSKFQIRLENYHFWKITHPKPQDPHLIIVNSTIRKKLEQLERLGSEDTPHHPMITHTIDQFISDPKSKQDVSQKIRKSCEI